MDIGRCLLVGFAATVVLTTVLSGSQGAGLTRMNIPFMLGTIFTTDRDRAKLVGFGLHFANGWLFSFLYCACFHALGEASPLAGAAIGAAHAAFVLTAGMSLLPGLHPRMAGETQGPDVVRQLEPPGFLALHYGVRTPISVLVAHVLFGAMLGAFYEV